MADDTWFTRALPILEAVAAIESSSRGPTIMPLDDLAASVSLEPYATSVEVERLIEGGYVAGNIQWDLSGHGTLYELRLGVAGARVTGMWPSPNPYEALVAILERRIAEAPDERTRSRWTQVRDRINGLAGDVGSNVLANLLVELMKAGI